MVTTKDKVPTPTVPRQNTKQKTTSEDVKGESKDVVEFTDADKALLQTQEKVSATQIPLVGQGTSVTPGESSKETDAAPSPVISVSNSDIPLTATVSSCVPASVVNVTTGNAASQNASQSVEPCGQPGVAVDPNSVIVHPPYTSGSDIPEQNPSDSLIIGGTDVGFTLNELRDRNQASWAAAYAKLTPLGHRYLKGKAFTKSWALKTQDFEEIINDAVRYLYRRSEDFCSGEDLKTHFIRALFRLAYDQVRRDTARRRGDGLVLVMDDVPMGPDLHYPSNTESLGEQGYNPNVLDWSQFETGAPHDTLAVRGAEIGCLHTLVEQWLTELENRDQELLRYVYYDLLQHREIAERLPAHIQSVGIMVRRSLDRLRRVIPHPIRRELAASYGPGSCRARI